MRWRRQRFILDATRRATVAQLGGKGSSLLQLTRAGIPVPRWIAISADAADRVLAPLRSTICALAESVAPADDEGAGVAARGIARLIREAEWPASLREQLKRTLNTLPVNGRFAVRSSGVDEDSVMHSFAGQLSTSLSVPIDRIADAVVECWASAFSDRSILYRRARGLSFDSIRIAVIIQEMIESAVSGVAFTADPTTGIPNHSIVAGYGLGEGVVLDLVETDYYVRPFDSTDWQRTVRQKTRRLESRPDRHAGTDLAAVPDPLRDQAALTDAQVKTLDGIVKRIERLAGAPQDIEWALDQDGEFWILQARPITTLPPGELAIWDDSNIGESYPGLTQPLTYSYVRFAYEQLFTQALEQVGVPQKKLVAARPSLAHLVGVIRGRLYLNLANFYQMFAMVPGLEASVRPWESAFGVTRHAELPATGSRRHLWSPLAHWVARGSTAARLALQFIGLESGVRRFETRLQVLLERHSEMDYSRLSAEQLLALYRQINTDFLEMWTLLIFNDLFAVRLTSRLAKLCGEPSGVLVNPSHGLLLHHRLLSGLANVASVAPARSALGLADQVSRNPALALLINSNRPAEEVWAEIQQRPELTGFRKEARRHLQQYGDRTLEELKFESSTMADRPWELVSVLRNCLNAPASMPSEEGLADREYRARFPTFSLRRLYALWVLRSTRRCLRIREQLSYGRARAYAVLRQIFRSIGKALAAAGSIQDPTDVFWLTIDELESYVGGSFPDSELAPIVERRRKQYERFANDSLPSRIVCRGPVYARAATVSERSNQNHDGEGRGQPCSPGLVRGTARVVNQPRPGDRVAGEILVARSTEPGWIWLLLAAKGLIVERGSLLSHAAIIGRELGIPTIVGVDRATQWISTGDEIEMDGGTGLIRRLNSP